MCERPYAIVEALSILGLKPTGVDRLSSSMLSHGLVERLKARYAVRVEAPPYSAARDAATGTLNADAIAAWTRSSLMRSGMFSTAKSFRSSSVVTARSCWAPQQRQFGTC